MTNTDANRDDLPVIAPRDDGFCPSTAACPQFYRFHKAHLCKIESNDYDMEGHICPVWASRTAARLEAVIQSVVDHQTHRDAWRRYAYGRGDRPMDFLDGNMAEGDRGPTAPERLEAVEEWNKDAAGVLELATGVPDNTIQIMRQEGLKIEDIEDPMQKLAFTIHTEACEIANKAEALLDTYPGKQPTSRQKDGQYD